REILRVGVALERFRVDGKQISIARTAAAKLGAARLTIDMAVSDSPHESEGVRNLPDSGLACMQLGRRNRLWGALGHVRNLLDCGESRKRAVNSAWRRPASVRSAGRSSRAMRAHPGWLLHVRAGRVSNGLSRR